MSVRPLRKLSRSQALLQFRQNPELAETVSAAARMWGCSRSTARQWISEFTASPPGDDSAASAPAMAAPQPPPPSPRRTNWPLVGVAYGLYGVAMGINVWNALGGALADVALPAAMGILAESGLFFLTAWLVVLRGTWRAIAIVVCLFFFGFAVFNGMRMASIISADQAMAREDRSTVGTEKADRDLERARSIQSRDCGPGKGKSKACQLAQGGVERAEKGQESAKQSVKAVARPETTDFARLIAWASFGRVEPSPSDFEMVWLLFRTLLPQIGGLVLMVARSGGGR